MVHFGLIPDGNRRWCNERNINLDELPNIWKDFLLKLIKEFGKLDLKNYKEFEQIKKISIYLASIDNVFRKDNTKYILHNIIKKVIDIINYPEEYIDKETIEIWSNYSKDIGLNIIGDMILLPIDIQLMIQKLKKRFTGKKYILNLALAYDYYKDILNEKDKENENYNRNQSNIDLVFRSGGEQRLSGFFPTKTIYSELFFNNKLFLDITIDDIHNVLIEYNKRERRYGK